MNLFVDGDGVGYRCGFAVEKTKYLVMDHEGRFRTFENAKEARTHQETVAIKSDVWSRRELEPLENALHLVDVVFNGLIDKYRPDRTFVYLSPSVGNFRESIATVAKYKGNRDLAVRPTYYKELFKHMVDRWGAEYAVGQEADDSLGIALTTDPTGVCVSFDKDLLQVPGRHYNWVEKVECTVALPESKLRFWQQALSGDPTDNIPGAAGIGSKKAEAYLKEVRGDKAAWETVLKVYNEIYGNDEGYKRALETARLVYVRRKTDETWSPPS